MANRNTQGFGLIAAGTLGSTPATSGQGKYKIDAGYATTAAAGSTTTGKSSIQLGISTAATTAKQLRVVRVAEDPENDENAAFRSVVVVPNLIELQS